jgi:uncharacterized protein (TIGR03792 family)
MDVAAADQAQFFARDREVWTSFLAAQPGFRHKETWVDPERPDVVMVMVWWETKEHWKAITAEQCSEVDVRMGEWLREPRCREYVVI